MRIHIAAALMALVSGGARAHLVAGSLSPKGGQSFKPGETATVAWGVEVPHREGIDVALSVDGGRTWVTIRSGLADEDKSGTYKWHVPNTPTTQAKLRICQTEKSPKCTDADGVGRASGPAPYVLVSGVFTIQAATAIEGGHTLESAPRLARLRGHDLRGRKAEARVFAPIH